MEINGDLAEIFGIHAGDGYLRTRERNKGEVDISGNVEEKEYYDNHVIPLFNNVFNLSMKGRYFSRGTYGFVTYKKEIRDVFIEHGFPAGKKSLIVDVPKSILNSKNKKIHARFLRGLFDTDGCLYFSNKKTGNFCDFKKKFHYYPIISLSTVSKQLCEDVSFMLNELSVKHFVYSNQPKNLRDSYRYTITVSGVERLERWMRIIGTKNRTKYTKYLVWKKFGFCPPHTTLKQREDFLNNQLDIYSLY